MTACELGAADRKGGLFRTLAGAYSDLVEFFVPDSLKRDREVTNRARMFLLSHIFGPVLGSTVPLALYAFDPTPGFEIAVLWVSILLFWVFPFLLRAGFAYRHLVLLSVGNLDFAILWSCFWYGGVASPTLTWVLIIPILSVFYIGGDRRQQPYVFAVSGLSFVTFAVLYLVIRPGPGDLPSVALHGLGTVSILATLCYMATMAIYYARIFDAGVDLEKEVNRRQAMAVETRKAVLAADRASTAKSEFLARMSHEIRTPLNAIIGYGQLLREEADDAGDKAMIRDIDRILDAGHYLVRLIGMILDLSKIEAGRMRFDLRPHALEKLLEAAFAQRMAAIEAGGNRTVLDIAPDLDEVVVDANRLREVVGGVLENAARHTRGGCVSIAARKVFEDGTAMFAIDIADTGCGIPPDIAETVFETFSVPREASDGRYGGTGLNLAVTSKLCRAMGGGITVKSVVGQGATFTITLPLGR